MRLAAIQAGVALRGAPVLPGWQARCVGFPQALCAALIARSLTAGALDGWAVRDALVARGDLIALHRLLVSVQTTILDAVAALNRIYRSHRLPKWQRSVLARCHLAPPRLAERLDAIWRSPPNAAIAEAELLLQETIALVREHVSVDLGDFERALARRRPAFDAVPS